MPVRLVDAAGAEGNFTAFRYMEERWALDLVERGEILLRPLAYYRECDERDLARRDPHEGKATRTAFVQRASLDALRKGAPFEASFVSANESNREIHFDRCSFERQHVADNFWSYCLSRVCTARLRREFKVDACVRIPQPLRFFETIGRAIGEDCARWIWADCVYQGRRFGAYEVDELISCFAKEPEYRSQCELRVMFEAAPGIEVTDRKLTIPELVGLCHMLR